MEWVNTEAASGELQGGVWDALMGKINAGTHQQEAVIPLPPWREHIHWWSIAVFWLGCAMIQKLN